MNKRILGKYVKQGSPTIEIQTNTFQLGDYVLLEGGEVREKFEVGQPDALAYCRLFISRRLSEGYESAIHGENYGD